MPPQIDYNDAFEKLVKIDAEGRVDLTVDHLTGLIAYGIYKQTKREYVAMWRAEFGHPPSEGDLRAWSQSQTGPTQLKGLRKNAAEILREYQRTAVVNATPAIQRNALRGAFWPSVRASMTGAALYTLSLILLSAALAFAGVDLIGIYQKIVTLID